MVKSLLSVKIINEGKWAPASPVRPKTVDCLWLNTNTKPNDANQLRMTEGDLVYLIDHNCISKRHWSVLHLTSVKVGLVPSDSLVRLTIAETRAWDRCQCPVETHEAEQLVKQDPDLPVGTFLVRKSNTQSDGYALSVRCGANQVQHYAINNQDSLCFIDEKCQFDSISDLIAHYSLSKHGLKTRLICPAPRDFRGKRTLREIDRQELICVTKIDEGNFGEVRRAKWRVNEVCVKSVIPGSMTSEALMAEARIMQMCDHPNLCTLLGVCTDIEPFYIVTEYMENENLLNYLRENNGDSKIGISFESQIDICAQVAAGMEYMEQHNLVHRDLAARNVLVGEVVAGSHVIKVADFGLAKALVNPKEYYAASTDSFPYKWTAPEAIQTHKFTIKSDVWSFGVLLYEIMTGGHDIYIGYFELQQKLQGGYREPRPKGCDQRVYDCMFSCWNAAPNQRPNFRVLREFFRNFFTESACEPLLKRMN